MPENEKRHPIRVSFSFCICYIQSAGGLIITDDNPSRGLFYAFLFSLPINGSIYSFILIWYARCLPPTDFLCTLVLASYCVLLYPQSNLLPKNVCFHTYTLNFVYCHPPILRCKYNIVLTSPTCMF